MHGIPQDELVTQQHEALRADGWLDPQEAKNIKEMLRVQNLLSAKYKESADHYVERVGILEEENRQLRARIANPKGKT